MRTSLILVVLGVWVAITFSVARAQPALNRDDWPEEAAAVDEAELEVEAADEQLGLRFPRATCDLLSFQSKWVTPNHAGCAAHCLALFRGFKGGSCKNGVCHCRK